MNTNPIPTIPRFDHNCDSCIFLGTVSYIDHWCKDWVFADLYHCPSDLMDGSCIARIGHEDYEYASAPMTVAKRLTPPFSTHGFALYCAAMAVLSNDLVDEQLELKRASCLPQNPQSV